jgi:hypothetical protein
MFVGIVSAQTVVTSKSYKTDFEDLREYKEWRLNTGRRGPSCFNKWYFGIALPIILITSACVLAFIHWDRKRKHHWTSKVLHIFVDLVITLSVASLCFFVNNRIIGAEVCVIIDACCLALLFFWLYANKSKQVRAWLSRKVFV